MSTVTQIEPSDLFPAGVVPPWVDLFAGDRKALLETMSVAVGPLPAPRLREGVPAEWNYFEVPAGTDGALVTVCAPNPADVDQLLDLARAALAAWIHASTPEPRRKS